ncbi:MAG: dephospho-CoA kinase [Deltaproteobacteria bacterium]|nr:dephospho-CoA kinase [Deltaproteobacteria bacterium]
MKLVVLTGGIASGKSAVCATLAEMGVPIIDADRIAREVVEPGRDAHREIVEAFGEAVLRPDGQVDREKLGKIIFSDPERRALLERITHPRIGVRIAERVAEHAAGGAQAVVLDIPLYLENLERGSGAPLPADAILVVHVDPETQLRRLMARDDLSRPEALARIEAQLPLDEKAGMADYVIDNSGEPGETARQARSVWERVTGGDGDEKALEGQQGGSR